MTLYDYLRKTSDWEITVWDEHYDVETYFYKTDGKEEWDNAMNELAKKLKIASLSENGVTVNLSEVIAKNLPSLKESDLFIECNLDAIMDSINAILSGNVSEKWLCKFVDSLKY